MSNFWLTCNYQIGLLPCGRPIFKITRMITDRIGPNSVRTLRPTKVHHTRKINKDSQSKPHSKHERRELRWERAKQSFDVHLKRKKRKTGLLSLHPSWFERRAKQTRQTFRSSEGTVHPHGRNSWETETMATVFSLSRIRELFKK